MSHLKEKNIFGETPFDISIKKGHLKCIKHLILSSWIEKNLDLKELINLKSIQHAIDHDLIEIIVFFISHPKRFAYIIESLIEYQGNYYNLVSNFSFVCLINQKQQQKFIFHCF